MAKGLLFLGLMLLTSCIILEKKGIVVSGLNENFARCNSCKKLDELPPSVSYLEIDGKSPCLIPPSVLESPNLETLIIWSSKPSFPTRIIRSTLDTLAVYGSILDSIPSMLSSIQGISSLIMYFNSDSDIGTYFRRNNKMVKSLNIGFIDMDKIPPGITNLEDLEILRIFKKTAGVVNPGEVSDLPENLSVLHLPVDGLAIIHQLSRLKKLKTLRLRKFSEIETFQDLIASLTTLDEICIEEISPENRFLIRELLPNTRFICREHYIRPLDW